MRLRSFAALGLAIPLFLAAQQPTPTPAPPPFTPVLMQKALDGDDTAEQALGYDYFHGIGVAKSHTASAHWYGLSAAHGNPASAYSLGVLYQKRWVSGTKADDIAAACRWFSKSASAGYVPAFSSLGDCYRHGVLSRDAKSNYIDAVLWYIKGSEKGDPASELELGDMYYRGTGVTRDRQRAIQLYGRAARAGNLAAQSKYEMLHHPNTPIDSELPGRVGPGPSAQ